MFMQNKRLTTYQQKRDFSKTPEPKGEEKLEKQKGLIFVIQKHAASHLHYDFRLEMDGILKSWALPKGPSLNPQDKRLAIETEDHPLSYKDFEGVIPKEQYGGGTVLVWDHGTYDCFSSQEDYKKGHLVVILKGQKLKGKFTLQRFKKKDKPQWLLIKAHDEYENSNYDVTFDNKSTISGKTLKEINPEAPDD